MFDDDHVGFNFWPAFADFMLALLLVFLIAFGIAHLTPRGVSPETARNCQESLERQFRASSAGSTGKASVEFERDAGDPFLLRIRFQNQLLFGTDDAQLKPAGEKVLRALGQIVRRQSASIREIQIHGHADVRASRRFQSNTHLAAERANSVFRLLRLYVDPAEHAMSITSYGEYFPAARRPGEVWTWPMILTANASEGGQQRNRRVELLLFYGEHAQPCAESKAKAGD